MPSREWTTNPSESGDYTAGVEVTVDYAYTGGFDGTLYKLDLADGSVLTTDTAASDTIRAIEFVDDQGLVTMNEDANIRVRDPETLAVEETQSVADKVDGADANENYIAVGLYGGSVDVFDWSLQSVWSSNQTAVIEVALMPDGSLYGLRDTNTGYIYKFDSDGNQIESTSIETAGSSISTDPDTGDVYVNDEFGSLYRFDSDLAQDWKLNQVSSESGIEFAADGWLYTITGSTIAQYDPKNGSEEWTVDLGFDGANHPDSVSWAGGYALAAINETVGLVSTDTRAFFPLTGRVLLAPEQAEKPNPILVNGASVTADGPSSDSQTTDSAGEFSLELGDEGEYSVVIERFDFSKEFSVVVEGKTETGDHTFQYGRGQSGLTIGAGVSLG